MPDTRNKQQVLKIASRVFKVPVEQVSEDSSPDTIPTWDSLLHMNFVLALEQEFNIRFDGEQIGEMRNIALVLIMLEEHGIT